MLDPKRCSVLVAAGLLCACPESAVSPDAGTSPGDAAQVVDASAQNDAVAGQDVSVAADGARSDISGGDVATTDTAGVDTRQADVGGGADAARPDASGGADAGGPGGFAWTEFTASADTAIIYVSSSDGDDGNDCLTEQNPCATLLHAESLLRDGFPDWMLLKRGDVWTQPLSDGWSFSWTKSGRDADEPLLISTYGAAAARPLIKAGEEHGFHRHRDSDLHDLALVGIYFEAHTKNPHSADYVGPQAREFQSGFRWTGGGEVDRILIEDCRFDYFGSNFAMHPSGDAPMFRDVSIRGNVFYSAWTGSSSDYSQGIYADRVDGLLIEGNVLDRNGGLVGFTDDPEGTIPGGLSAEDVTVTWYNHQAYVQSGNRNVVVRNNIFANGDGVQLRPGGVAEDNLFTRTINALSIGPATTPVAGGVTGSIRANVFVEGTDFAPASATPGVRGNGIHIANIDPARGVLVEDNHFLRDMSADRYGSAVQVAGADCGSGNAYPCAVDSVTIRGNVVFNWRGGFRFSGALGSEITGIVVEDNLLQNPDDDAARLLSLNSGYAAADFSFSGNSYHRGGNASWFDVNGGLDFAGWTSLSGETGAQALQVSFPESSRSLATYNQMQGGAASHQDFMARARQQQKRSWDPAYEARSVNAYLRGGF